MTSTPPDQPFFPQCNLPIDNAIAAFSEQFKQIERGIDQVLNGTPVKATGSFKFCDGLTPPFNWGVPPVQTVNVSPDGVVSVSPAAFDPTKYVSIGGIKSIPFIDFFPQDPVKSGTFGRLELSSHFSTRKAIPSQFEIVAENRSFHFLTYSGFTDSDIGKYLKITIASNPGNVGLFKITAVPTFDSVICGEVTTLVDESPVPPCDLAVTPFVPEDATNNRLLTLSGTPIDGQYRILTYVSSYEVVVDFPSPTYHESDFSWKVSYPARELLNMIVLSRPFANHPQVTMSLGTDDVTIEAKQAGTAGNSIAIEVGSGLPFICPGGSHLTGGKDGALSEDKATAEASMNDVYESTNTILSLGGTNSEEVTTSQNVIPPGLSFTELQRRINLCGFPTVGRVPLTKGTPRMRGYSILFELCGFDILRDFLRNGKPGDRYVVSVDLIPSFKSDPSSCGTNNLDTLAETPMCGVYPKDAPEAIMYYVFHHTAPLVSPSAVAALSSQGFTMEQISVLMNPDGAVEENVTSVVIPYTSAIEEAIQLGFTVDEISSVLKNNIEDWKYDATNSDLLNEVNKLRLQASSATARVCFTRYWGNLDETKFSGGVDGIGNINASVCEITDLSLRKAVEFILKQNDKIAKMMAKVKDITSSLSSALSLDNFIQKNLANFPNDTMRCLISGIPIPQVGVSLEVAPSLADPIANFGNMINPKINAVGDQIKGLLGRATSVLSSVSQAVCLLQKTTSSMLGWPLGCLVPDLSLNLPQCALDMIQHTFDLLDSLNASIDLSLSMVATLESSMSALASLNILSQSQDTGGPAGSSCDDSGPASFLGSVGINAKVL